MLTIQEARRGEVATNEHLRRALAFMTEHNFTNKRADKIRVEGVDGVEEYEREDGIVTTGVVKKVEHYTMRCPECDAAGYYDEKGDVICPECGIMIGADRQAVVPHDHSNSRGFSNNGDHAKGFYEPS